MKLRELLGLTLPGENFEIWEYSDDGQRKRLHNGFYSSMELLSDHAVCSQLDRQVVYINSFRYDDVRTGLEITLGREE